MNVCECQYLVSVWEPQASTPVLRQMSVAGLNLPRRPFKSLSFERLRGGKKTIFQLFRFISKSALQTCNRVEYIKTGLDTYPLAHT